MPVKKNPKAETSYVLIHAPTPTGHIFLHNWVHIIHQFVLFLSIMFSNIIMLMQTHLVDGPFLSFVSPNTPNKIWHAMHVQWVLHVFACFWHNYQMCCWPSVFCVLVCATPIWRACVGYFVTNAQDSDESKLSFNLC